MCVAALGLPAQCEEWPDADAGEFQVAREERRSQLEMGADLVVDCIGDPEALADLEVYGQALDGLVFGALKAEFEVADGGTEQRVDKHSFGLNAVADAGTQEVQCERVVAEPSADTEQ